MTNDSLPQTRFDRLAASAQKKNLRARAKRQSDGERAATMRALARHIQISSQRAYTAHTADFTRGRAQEQMLNDLRSSVGLSKYWRDGDYAISRKFGTASLETSLTNLVSRLEDAGYAIILERGHLYLANPSREKAVLGARRQLHIAMKSRDAQMLERAIQRATDLKIYSGEIAEKATKRWISLASGDKTIFSGTDENGTKWIVNQSRWCESRTSDIYTLGCYSSQFEKVFFLNAPKFAYFKNDIPVDKVPEHIFVASVLASPVGVTA